jgi:hypothetical protein
MVNYQYKFNNKKVLSHFKWVMREEIHRNSPLIKGEHNPLPPFSKGELPTHFEKEPIKSIKCIWQY